MLYSNVEIQLMEDIQRLYNTKTDTLIVLQARGALLEVRDEETNIYELNREDFIPVFLLCLCKGKILRNEEILELLNDTDIKIETNKVLRQRIVKVKKLLSKYRVYNLIVDVGKGYTISQDWVEPQEVKPKAKAENLPFAQYIKSLCNSP